MTLDDQQWKEHIAMLKASKEASQGAIAPIHPEDVCDDCGGPNVTWFAPSPLWNLIVRNSEKADPMLCPRCFVLRAEAKGIHKAWKLTPES